MSALKHSRLSPLGGGYQNVGPGYPSPSRIGARRLRYAQLAFLLNPPLNAVIPRVR